MSNSEKMILHPLGEKITKRKVGTPFFGTWQSAAFHFKVRLAGI